VKNKQQITRGVFECPRCGKENQSNFVIQNKDMTLSLGGCEDCFDSQKDRQIILFANELKLTAEKYEAMIADQGKFIVQHYSRFMSEHPDVSSPLRLAQMIMQDKWKKEDALTGEELSKMFEEKGEDQ
jgi:hypothetical protein